MGLNINFQDLELCRGVCVGGVRARVRVLVPMENGGGCLIPWNLSSHRCIFFSAPPQLKCHSSFEGGVLGGAMAKTFHRYQSINK